MTAAPRVSAVYEGTVTHVRARHGRGFQTGIAFTRVSPENLTTLRRATGRTH